MLGKQSNPHGDLNFDCGECHNLESWQFDRNNATFDHTQTGFILKDAHEMTECRSCHLDLIFNHIGINCVDCHTDIHKNEFGMNCEDCHTQQSWENRLEIFKEHNLTQFPLIGVHAAVECEACHINQQRNEYKNTPVECKDCHSDVYSSVKNPDHVANNFDKNCMECHNPDRWSPAIFNHDKTHFPLTGKHKMILCDECHSQGYVNLPTDCWSCHESDFSISSDPDHIQNNFSHECDICHSTNAWSPAEYNHDKTGFPLTGTHNLLECSDCHIQGYSGLSADCFACHETEYNNTTNPNHISANFPQDCESCHNTTNWNQTTWDHDSQYFPIYSGKHRGEWDTCDECHVNANDYSAFECIDCHEHSNKSRVDNQHNEVTNYVYASYACYDCHPDGREESNLFKLRLQNAH